LTDKIQTAFKQTTEKVNLSDEIHEIKGNTRKTGGLRDADRLSAHLPGYLSCKQHYLD
jgi:hypothetical protein